MAFGMGFFRKYRGFLLLALAVVLMLTWFVAGPMIRLLTPVPVVGEMFGEEVTRETWDQARLTLNVMNYGGRFEDDDIWSLVAMELEADRMGVQVSDAEVLQGVRDWVSNAMRGQAGDPDLMYGTLRGRLGVSDRVVENAVRQNLRVQKILTVVAGAAAPTEAEMWDAYVKAARQTSLKTLAVPVSGFSAQAPKPSEEELKAWYETNKESYRIPPKATVGYASAMEENYAQLFTVKDEDIERYYEQNKDSLYLLPPKVESTESQASLESTDAVPAIESAEARIESTDAAAAEYKPLAEVAPDIRRALLKQAAENTLNDIKYDLSRLKDTTLEQQAARYGLPYIQVGPLSQQELSNLDDFAGAKVNADLSVIDAIFPTPPDQPEIASGAKGYYMFSVLDILESSLPEFEAVRDKVEADYIAEKATKLALDEAGKALEGLRAEGWDKYAADAKYRVSQTPLAVAPEPKPVADAADAVETGAFGGPVLADEAAYVFQVVERREPSHQEYEQYKSLALMGFNFPGMPAWIPKWQEAVGGKTSQFVQDWRKDLLERAHLVKYAAQEAPQPSSVRDLDF